MMDKSTTIILEMNTTQNTQCPHPAAHTAPTAEIECANTFVPGTPTTSSSLVTKAFYHNADNVDYFKGMLTPNTTHHQQIVNNMQK
jgi:hypothetical protein